MQLLYATELLLFSRVIRKHTHTFLLSWNELKNSISVESVVLHLEPFPLPHCEVSNLPSVASGAHTTCHEVWSFNIMWQPCTAHTGHEDILQLFCWELLNYPPYCSGYWSNTWEVTDSTIIRKWKWMVVDGGKCKNADSAMIEYLNLCQDSLNMPVCLGIALKIMIRQWN
jgi:hypothetical protein